MRKTKFSKVVIMVVMVVSLCLLGTKSFASLQIPNVDASTNEQPTTNSGTTNTTTNTTTPPTTNTVKPTTNTVSSNYINGTNLPKTGDASDYALFALIGVALVVAVYAFKKVRDYNIK